jgi:hypothetical protein
MVLSGHGRREPLIRKINRTAGFMRAKGSKQNGTPPPVTAIETGSRWGARFQTWLSNRTPNLMKFPQKEK